MEKIKNMNPSWGERMNKDNSKFKKQENGIMWYNISI